MQLRDLLPAAILLGVTVVGLTVMADITQNIYNDQTAGSVAKNVSGEGLFGLRELGSWSSTIGLVIAAGLIIGILIGAFQFRQR